MEDWLFDASPRLPKECSCGNTSSETCLESGLRNHHNFPPFACLPDEYDAPESYYAMADGWSVYSPIRHWALVGDIVDVSFFIRPRVTIRTRYGERVLVNFHLEDANAPTFFEWNDLRTKGPATLIILYPLHRVFMDMNQGVRQENPDSAMVFPVCREKLEREVDSCVAAAASPHHPRCFRCDEIETKERKLLQCSRCKIARYCGRDCQIAHWRESHKKLCKHTTMLSKFSRFDFSIFQDHYVDWNFVVKEPFSAEEKRERSKQLMREAMYRRGLLDSELASPATRLACLLSAIKDKSLGSDVTVQKYQSSSMMIEAVKRERPEQASIFTGPLCTTFLFQGLLVLSEGIKCDPKLRYHVVDMCGPERSGGFGGYMADSSMSHFILAEVLDCIFFALPIWQHEKCIGKISWSFESQGAFSRGASLYERGDPVWSVYCDHEHAIIKNRESHTCTFLSDETPIVADIGERMAQDRSDEMVIRVLRVTANAMRKDTIRQLATNPNLPDNLYTIWIRENVPSIGRFNPPSRAAEQSLVEQLVDTENISMEEMFIRSLGVPASNILRPPPAEAANATTWDASCEPVDCVECASCGEVKSWGRFSNTQLRRKGRYARCKRCIHRGASP